MDVRCPARVGGSGIAVIRRSASLYRLARDCTEEGVAHSTAMDLCKKLRANLSLFQHSANVLPSSLGGNRAADTVSEQPSNACFDSSEPLPKRVDAARLIR